MGVVPFETFIAEVEVVKLEIAGGGVAVLMKTTADVLVTIGEAEVVGVGIAGATAGDEGAEAALGDTP